MITLLLLACGGPTPVASPPQPPSPEPTARVDLALGVGDLPEAEAREVLLASVPR